MTDFQPDTVLNIWQPVHKLDTLGSSSTIQISFSFSFMFIFFFFLDRVLYVAHTGLELTAWSHCLRFPELELPLCPVVFLLVSIIVLSVAVNRAILTKVLKICNKLSIIQYADWQQEHFL